ncbi:UNVERIFIED_CONTAM: hypothetical protein RMT77_019856 [Armadillidium vulgare]
MKPLSALSLFMLICTFTNVLSDPFPDPEPDANPGPEPDPQLVAFTPYVPQYYGSNQENLEGKVVGVLVSAVAFKALAAKVYAFSNQYQSNIANLQISIASLRSMILSEDLRIDTVCTCLNSVITALNNAAAFPLSLPTCSCTN